MYPSPPVRSQQSYRHEAFLWRDPDDFVAGLGPFLADGLNAGEPTLVAVTPEHSAWLQDSLGSRAAEVEFVDMREMGRNPGRILPALQHFLDRRSGGLQPVRAIGEPIWPGRRAEELVECQLHEALLNVAVDPSTPFWLVCPYDVGGLSADVVEEAYRSHPVIVETDSFQGSPTYAGRAHVDALFGAELTELSPDARRVYFSPRNLARLWTYLKLELYLAGLSQEEAAELAEVVQRLAESSLQRGSTGGEVRIWAQPSAVVCEVADHSVVSNPLLGRRLPQREDHDALWHANQVCDLVQLRSTDQGTAVRVHRWL